MIDKLVPPFEGIDDAQALGHLGDALVAQYPKIRSGVLLAIADYHDIPRQPTLNDVDNTVHRLEDLARQAIAQNQDSNI